MPFVFRISKFDNLLFEGERPHQHRLLKTIKFLKLNIKSIELFTLTSRLQDSRVLQRKLSFVILRHHQFNSICPGIRKVFARNERIPICLFKKTKHSNKMNFCLFFSVQTEIRIVKIKNEFFIHRQSKNENHVERESIRLFRQEITVRVRRRKPTDRFR